MKAKYRPLCEAGRGEIYRMKKAGKTQSEIAQALGVSQGTPEPETHQRLRDCRRPRIRYHKAFEAKA